MLALPLLSRDQHYAGVKSACSSLDFHAASEYTTPDAFEFYAVSLQETAIKEAIR